MTPVAQSQSLWKEISLPQTSHSFSFVDFSDSLNGMVFSDKGTYAVTEDGGKSWMLDSIRLTNTIIQIKTFPKNVCWLVTRKVGSIDTIYFTLNGKEWNHITIPESISNSMYGKVGFSTPTTVWLPSVKGILLSSNAGASWSVNRQSSGMMCTIVFVDSLKGYLAFQTSGAGGELYGKTFTTSNGGARWDTIAHDWMLSYRTIRFYNASTGYFYSTWTGIDGMPTYHYVAATYDGGKTLHNITGSDLYDPIGCILYSTGKQLLITRRSTIKKFSPDSSMYYLSSDSGGEKILEFESFSEHHNWILTTGNRLFQNLNVPTSMQEIYTSVPGQFRLGVNYPNPFNPSTNLEYELPYSSHITIFIYDILGREKICLVNDHKEAGKYTVRWDATHAAAGLYFARMNAKGYTATTRLVLLK